jgi:hypothetical protein
VAVFPLLEHLFGLLTVVSSFHILHQNQSCSQELVLGDPVNLDFHKFLVGFLFNGNELLQFLVIAFKTRHVLVETLFVLLDGLPVIRLVDISDVANSNVVLPALERLLDPYA